MCGERTAAPLRGERSAVGFAVDAQGARRCEVVRQMRAAAYSVVADGLQVAQGLGPGHSPSRRLTSSCGMPWPASSSARPASILARKTGRSMASSNVALSGRSRSASRIRSRPGAGSSGRCRARRRTVLNCADTHDRNPSSAPLPPARSTALFGIVRTRTGASSQQNTAGLGSVALGVAPPFS